MVRASHSLLREINKSEDNNLKNSEAFIVHIPLQKLLPTMVASHLVVYYQAGTRLK